jgi:hypothetical protein
VLRVLRQKPWAPSSVHTIAAQGAAYAQVPVVQLSSETVTSRVGRPLELRRLLSLLRDRSPAALAGSQPPSFPSLTYNS